jgi:hypothetical protein
MRAYAKLLVLAAALAPAACATYHDDLARAEHAYDASEHERALAMFRLLEPDTDRLSESERAHYAYLRGMTDLKIGYKADARHWLTIAAADEQQTPGSLPADWSKRLGESLKELNEEVYTAGVESLGNSTDKPKGKGDTSGGSSDKEEKDVTNPAVKPE